MAINNYQISPQLNPNKVFILQKSEVEKRLDPAFYNELRTNKFEFSYPSKIISRIVKSFSGGTPDKSISSYWNGDICWASPKDMKDFYLLNTQDKTTPEGIKNSSASVAPIGSILIVFRSGILQHTLPVSITEVETAINQDLKVLVPSEEILSEYLATFLTTFEKRILPRIVKHSTTVQSINQEEFNQLPIPIPPIDIQRRIIDIKKASIDFQKQNEAQAKKLLSSIDEYLLKELGINLPEPAENSLKNRMFATSMKDLSGNRLDCYYYFTAGIEAQIDNGLYRSVKFSTLLHSVINGFDFRDYKETGTPYIKVANVRKGAFDFSKIQYIEQVTTEIGKAIQLKKGNLLLTRKGTFGYALCLEEDYDYVISSEIFYLDIKKELIDPNYLESFFNSNLGQKQFDRVKIGAIMGSLSQEAVKSLKIPLPPLPKQKEISDHISAIRRQAEQLKAQTAEAMAEASTEIEKLLIG